MRATTAAAAAPTSLDGRWKAVYVEIDGQKVPDSDVDMTLLEIKGTTFKVEKNGTIEYEGRLTTNPSTHPQEIVLFYDKSAKPQFMGGARPGVYELVGNTLKMCIGMIGHTFPKELSTYDGSLSALSVHVREQQQPRAAQAAWYNTSVLLW